MTRRDLAVQAVIEAARQLMAGIMDGDRKKLAVLPMHLWEHAQALRDALQVERRTRKDPA